MSTLSYIQKGWRKWFDVLTGEPRYFDLAPSTFLQRKNMISVLKTYAKGKLIDVGAGRSIYLPFIPKNVKYSSVDFSETENTYKKYRPLDFVGDIKNLPFNDGAFDTVLCTEVLEHVPDTQHSIQELLRILQPSGHLIITVPFLGYYHDEPHDYYRFTKHGLRALLQKNNTTIVELYSVGGFFCFLGYIRSTVLLGLCADIPVIRTILFWINYAFLRLDVVLDAILNTKSILPLTNVIIVRKN